MRKKIASAAMAGIIATGVGVGAVVSTPMAALAADAPATATADTAPRSPMQWATDALKGLVDKGTITQAQSDAVSQALQDAKPDHGPGGHGGPGRMSMAKAAEVSGISEADLQTALADHTKSLADVAKEKNVDPQKVIDALVAEENTEIDQQLASGDITQAQADQRKANVTQRVTDRVNNAGPQGRGGPGGGEPPADAPAPADAAAAPAA